MMPTLPCLRIGPLLPQAETAAWTTPEERRSVEKMNPRRRCEYLTWRTLVRRLLGPATAIGYNRVGAPVVPGGPCLSVAHCAGRVVVCLSEEPCAVDIEPESRAFGRVAPHYMTDAERGLCAHPLWPGIAWCSKEALYKYAGRKGLDLLRDLRLEGFDQGGENVTAPEVRSVCGETDYLPESRPLLTESKAGNTTGPIAAEAAAGTEVPACNDSYAGAEKTSAFFLLPEPYRFFGTVAGRIDGGERLRIRIYRGEGYLVACIV